MCLLCLIAAAFVIDWGSEDVFEGNEGRTWIIVFMLLSTATLLSTISLCLSRKYLVFAELIGPAAQIGMSFAILVVNGTNLLGDVSISERQTQMYILLAFTTIY